MTSYDLSSLIKKVDWLKIQPHMGKTNLARTNVQVGYIENKSSGITDQVIIRIGRQVLDELEWDYKDSIYIENDPDDLKNYRLVKSNGGNGYKLGKESNVHSGRILFRWPHLTVPLKPMKPFVVEHLVYNKSLFFRV